MLDSWNDDNAIAIFFGVATIATYDTEDPQFHRLRCLNSENDVWTYILLQIAAPHGEDQQGVFLLRRPSREPRMRKVKASGVWVALDPNDVHASSALARIEGFVRMAALQTGRRSTPARGGPVRAAARRTRRRPITR